MIINHSASHMLLVPYSKTKKYQQGKQNFIMYSLATLRAMLNQAATLIYGESGGPLSIPCSSLKGENV